MMQPAVPGPGGNLRRLTSLRAFAALAVFGIHSGSAFGWQLWQRLFGLGYAGVGFFFVLSGFVLTWATKPTMRPQVFWWRRFARIYPVYIVLGIIVGTIHTFGSAWSTAAYVLGIQAWDPRDGVHFALLGASWSLSDEAFFYAIWPFAVGMALRHWQKFSAAAVLAFVAGASVTAAFVYSGSQWITGAYVNPLVRLGQFLLGVALAVAVQRGLGPRVPVAAAVMFFVVGWEFTRKALESRFPLPDYMLTPAFVVLIYAAAKADLRGARGLLSHPVLVYAGEVSFCFYLVHQQGIGLVEHEGWGGAGPPGRTLASLIVACLFAVAVHHLIERPARKWLLSSPRVMSRT